MRYVVHAAFVIALPVIVAAFGLSVLSAAALVGLALLWRWGLAMTALVAKPGDTPAYEIDTIPMSHFAEKARWCLDRLGVEYTERPSAGIIGVLFTGRTVPRLRFRTGRTRSSLGNSAEILRYLWGAHAATLGEKAAFLEPTEERLDWERRLDRYGVDLQVWVYYHILDERDVTLRLWGGDDPAVPGWQRLLARAIYPLLALFLRRAFAIDARHYAKAVEHVERILRDVENQLEDGRTTLGGEGAPTFVDLTYAALSGLWLQPAGYGGGRAEDCLIRRDALPPPMQADIEAWIENYPKATQLIETLYANERIAGHS